MPHDAGNPALVQRRSRRRPAGVTAPTPVTTTVGHHGSRALRHQVDRVADGLDLGDVARCQLDAELLLDDLRELGEVERVDVERLERRVAEICVGVGAEGRRGTR